MSSSGDHLSGVSIAFRSDKQPVGKVARLGKDGRIVAKVPTARAHPDRLRVGQVHSAAELAALVDDLRPHDHLLFGIPRADPPANGVYEVGYAGSLKTGQIALTKGHLVWPNDVGVMYLDVDVKEESDQPLFPPSLRNLAHVDVMARFLACTANVRAGLPEHAHWPGSSANLTAPNGEKTGSGSLHIGLIVEDASDIERAGAILHKRSVMNGDGWPYVCESGSVEVRSLFDTKVWAPNRAIYAGGAACCDGIAQTRVALAVSGERTDSRHALPDLNDAENAAYLAAVVSIKESAKALATDRRANWMQRQIHPRAQAKANAAGSEVTETILAAARVDLERTLDHGELTDEHQVFGLTGGKQVTVTVAELRANRAKYDGMTCADPINPDYDGGRRTVAKFFANLPSGLPTINDLHTGTIYLLKPSAAETFDSFSDDEPSADGDSNVVAFSEFISARRPPEYVVERLFAKNYVYALTAAWGAGKTAVAVTLAVLVAGGAGEVCGLRIEPGRVLYLSGENPDDVSLRAEQTAKHLGIAESTLNENLCFTRRPFAANNDAERAAFVAEAAPAGKFDLVVIDTSSAHSDVKEENSNAEMHRVAQAFRNLGREVGDGPAVLVLCHPAKSGQSKESMQPRGGGAFSASVDGELTLVRQEHNPQFVELSHRMKFRGPGFNPVVFKLEAQQVAGLFDNFLNPASTVVAVPTDPQDIPVLAGAAPTLTSNARLALQAVRNANILAIVDGAIPRGEAYDFYDDNVPTTSVVVSRDAQVKARKRAFDELEKKGVIRLSGSGRSVQISLVGDSDVVAPLLASVLELPQANLRH